MNILTMYGTDLASISGALQSSGFVKKGNSGMDSGAFF